ncbi:MAG TPA: ABC transporter permease [Vicinamibacterales bacterium]|nr:ABC transporter permease [Vicinamibacterales bacterium]
MFIGAIVEDLRFALRQIRRAPGFAISAALTLALGIGANTGIFSLLNGYLRPLPVPDADRIVVLAAEMPGDDTGFRFGFSLPALNDYRTETGAFSDVFGFETRIAGFTAHGKTTQFLYHAVTGNLFTGLQLPPAAGRAFEPGEGERLGTESVVMLSYLFWQRRFGGDPAVVGTVVRIDGVPTRVIGVTPKDFHGLYQGAAIEGFVPLGSLRGRSSDPGRFLTDRTLRFLTVVARLRPGVSVETAQAAVDVVARRLQRTYPQEKDVTARVIPEPLARPVPMRFLSSLMPLIRGSMLGLATLVLLIACMNVANLLLVRGTVRQREMAMRAALGSGRARLIRLLLCESLLLSFAGMAAGLLLARWATGLFLGTIDIGSDLPLNLDFHYDWRVFLYAGAISGVTGVLMGIVPALRASRVDVRALLHDGGHGSAGAGRQRLRSAMVVAQVAGSLVLLIVAGLCMRSLQRAQFVDLGFDAANIVTARLDPHQIGYDEPRSIAFYDELERRLAGLPGVDAVAMSFSVPTGYILDGAPAAKEGEVLATEEPRSNVTCNTVTPSFFDTLKIPIVRGRGFTAQDTSTSTRVVIVNETLARQIWPGQDPIGKRLIVPRPDGRLWEVVGVARDSKYIAVFEGQLPHMYFSLEQSPFFMRVVYVRSAAPPESLKMLVEREIHALDADMPIADARPLREIVEGGVGFVLFHIGSVQAGAMGLLGLILAVVGVYGVVSYGASLRMREMGIRVALGASPAAVRGLVLRQGSVLVVIGIVCGLAIAAAVTRTLSTFFVLVGSLDVLTFAGVTALLSAIALVACYLPARRAMRVDPMTALRHE